MDQQPTTASTDASRPPLAIESLKFRYTANTPWVVDVGDFTLAAGEQVLLRGGSGRGKSTLLQLIAGLMDPTGGSIEVAGQPIHTLHGAGRDEFRLRIHDRQRLVALWHTHGAPGYLREYFSPQDAQLVRKLQRPLYLLQPGTPPRRDQRCT